MRILRYTAVFSMAALSAPLLHAQSRGEVRMVESADYVITRQAEALPTYREKMELIAPFKQKVDSVRSPLLGRSARYMNATRPESLLSNFVADVFLSMSKKYGHKADLAICNVGGLRNVMPKGDITYGIISDIAPFNNRYSYVYIKGEHLMQIFHEIAAEGGEGVSGNVKLTITKNRKLKEGLLNGKAINPKKTYVIATLDYLAEGNDGLDAMKLADKRKVLQNTYSRDVLIRYIKEQMKLGKEVDSKLDGRITVVDEYLIDGQQ